MSFGFDCCCCCPCKTFIITLNQNITVIQGAGQFTQVLQGLYSVNFIGIANVQFINGNNPNPGIPKGTYCVWASKSPVAGTGNAIILMHNTQKNVWYLFVGGAQVGSAAGDLITPNSQTIYQTSSTPFPCDDFSFSGFADVVCACCKCDPKLFAPSITATISGYVDHTQGPDVSTYFCRDDNPNQPPGNCNISVPGTLKTLWSVFNRDYNLTLGGDMVGTWGTRIKNVPIVAQLRCPNKTCSPDIDSTIYATVAVGVTVGNTAPDSCICQIGGAFLYFLYTGLNETGGFVGNGGFICQGEKFIDCSNGPPGLSCIGHDFAGQPQTINFNAPMP